MKQDEIINEIEEMTSNYNFINLIVMIIFRDFVGTIESLSNYDRNKNLNYNELSYLIGLWIKNAKNNKKIDINLNKQIPIVYDLMYRLHRTFLPDLSALFEDSNNHKDTSDLMLQKDPLREAFFYGPCGAYDYQYSTNSFNKYKYDIEWIKKEKGFNLDSLNSFFLNIKNTINVKINILKKDRKKRYSINEMLGCLIMTHEELVGANVDFDLIAQCFTCELEGGYNKSLRLVGDFNEFSVKPIIKLGKKFFIPMPFFLAESIYDSPFYWMVTDKKYFSTCTTNRGKIAEEIVYDLLIDKFNHSDVFKSIKIKKDKSQTDVSDIDVMAINNEDLLLFQIKSKRITSLARQGDVEKLKEDFKKAVEDAFVQGIECSKAIYNYENYNFLNSDGVDIREKLKSVKNIYVICALLEVFPAIPHLSQFLLYEKYAESGVCINVFDLEIICKLLKTPKKIIDYFSKRINNCRHYYADSEMSFLGFYINHDLKKRTEYDVCVIDNAYAGNIDKIYYSENQNEKIYNTIPKIIESRKQIGRNDPCPCGSGQKFKKCHGK
ncbi:SEC-C metal-binding domain-containing protein [Siphonobacter curvatus]|nr:SEC-C metal-binding domain-containing protein [Siphonobacter curvatus]